MKKVTYKNFAKWKNKRIKVLSGPMKETYLTGIFVSPAASVGMGIICVDEWHRLDLEDDGMRWLSYDHIEKVREPKVKVPKKKRYFNVTVVRTTLEARVVRVEANDDTDADNAAIKKMETMPNAGWRVRNKHVQAVSAYEVFP